MAKLPLGSGARFKALVKKLESRKGKYKVRDAKRLAAWIGRKKYGAKQFQKMASTVHNKGRGLGKY
jgi:hypothetical protein